MHVVHSCLFCLGRRYCCAARYHVRPRSRTSSGLRDSFSRCDPRIYEIGIVEPPLPCYQWPLSGRLVVVQKPSVPPDDSSFNLRVRETVFPIKHTAYRVLTITAFNPSRFPSILSFTCSRDDLLEERTLQGSHLFPVPSNQADVVAS